ncbi:hypothetical protein C8J56DRAFT_483929 [Mycena floridula]|nr:hypothetical protein C8J56DRAFT_483929 [Mycena floridula]
MSDSDLYAKLLFPRRRGYPLWTPEPNRQLPHEYRSVGQRIGDVGVITPDGGFDFLFNICHQADHPIHVRGVPPNFVPINPDTLELDEIHPFHSPNTDITTQNIRKTDIQVGITGENIIAPGAAVGFEFHISSRSSEGAILMLPEGGSRVDLRNKKSFYQIACQNAAAWYEYATETRGRIISEDSLYLVTGCDKCTSWCVAAFSHPSRTVSSSLKLKATSLGGIQGALTYEWDNTTSVAARSGPPELSPLLNQCVFLRGFKISFRRRQFSKVKTRITLIEETKLCKVLPKIVSDASESPTWSPQSSLFTGRHSSETHQPLEEPASEDLESNSSSSPTSSSGEDEVYLQEVPACLEGIHPLELINQYLLEKTDSTTAVTHDDVWTSVLDENDEWLPDFPDLIKRIEKRYRIVLDKGVASFAGRPSIHQHSSSSYKYSQENHQSGPRDSISNSSPSVLYTILSGDSSSSNPGHRSSSITSPSRIPEVASKLLANRIRQPANPPLPSSWRSKPQPSTSRNITSPSPIPEATSKPLGNRIRSSSSSTLPSFQFHPLLREGGMVDFDLCHPARVRNPLNLTDTACDPPQYHSIILRGAGFNMKVSPHRGSFLTVGDIITQLHFAFQVPVSRREFDELHAEKQRDLSVAFYKRCDDSQAEMMQGLKKLDYLQGMTRFRGLKWSSSRREWQVELGHSEAPAAQLQLHLHQPAALEPTDTPFRGLESVYSSIAELSLCAVRTS